MSLGLFNSFCSTCGIAKFLLGVFFVDGLQVCRTSALDNVNNVLGTWHDAGKVVFAVVLYCCFSVFVDS